MKRSRCYSAIVCIMLVLAIFLPMNLNAAPGDIVFIPDSNFKSTINSLLGQAVGSDVTQAQMASLTTLTINNPNIEDLTGLEFAVNAMYLRMTQNSVTNLDSLKSLLKLEQLYLSGTNITSSNFPDLSHITTLEHIDLDDSAVDNAVLDKIALIKSLTYVQIQRNTSITTIAPLTALPNLKTVFIQFSGVTDFTIINDMSPTLTQLYATGQNTGRIDPPTPRERTNLNYNPTAQTIYLPFASMPNVKTNFDGQKSLFSTLTNDTYMEINSQEIDSSRLTIDDNGVTISGVTLNDFNGIEQILYNARYNQPAGSYATPPGFTNYYISGGTYLHLFDISDRPIILANSPIYYWQDFAVDETTFLADIDARTNDGTPITSDFTNIVDFSIPGAYKVTLNAKLADGVEADPVEIDVIVQPRPTISSKNEITYYQYSVVTEESFFQDVEALTEINNQIFSNFLNVVDFSTINDYKVTLYAENAQGIKSTTKEIVVHIIPRDIQSYTLMFDLNGATGEVPPSQTLPVGSLTLEPTIPIREGYLFLGWNESKDGSTPMWDFSKSTMPARNITLYARWQRNDVPILNYDVYFDLNGASGTPPPSQTLSEGSLITQPISPIRDGYQFQGWNTRSDGSGLMWQFNETRMPAKTLTLYAQWTKNDLPDTGIASSHLWIDFGLIVLGVTIVFKYIKSSKN